MTRFGFLVVLAVLLAIVLAGFGTWFLAHSRPAAPIVPQPIAAAPCAPGKCPSILTEADAGKAFTYPATSRFTVMLDGTRFPKAELACVPEGVIGSISNEPSVEPPRYAARFEGVSPGTCTLSDRGFSATIVITGEPAFSTGPEGTTGSLSGTMTIGPLCPVERADAPCTATSEQYAAHPVTVYAAGRTETVATLIPDASGRFVAALPPGTYVVDVAHGSTPPTVRGVPATITITAGSTTPLSIDIDTGIR